MSNDARDVNLWQEITFPTLSFVLFIGYFIRSAQFCRRYQTCLPTHRHACSSRSAMRLVRAAWVREQMQKGTIPVNTFRDILRSAMFFGSAAIVIVFTLLGVSLRDLNVCFPQRLELTASDANDPCPPRNQLFLAKNLLLAAVYFFVFFCFSQTIRFVNHTSILVNTKRVGRWRVTPEFVTMYLARGYRFWAAGLRFVYFSIPLCFWYIGPIWMFASTVVLVFMVLRPVDRFDPDQCPLISDLSAPASGLAEPDLEAQQANNQLASAGSGGLSSSDDRSQLGLPPSLPVPSSSAPAAAVPVSSSEPNQMPSSRRASSPQAQAGPGPDGVGRRALSLKASNSSQVETQSGSGHGHGGGAGELRVGGAQRAQAVGASGSRVGGGLQVAFPPRTGSPKRRTHATVVAV